LQSTKELKVIFGAGINLNFGVGIFSTGLGSSIINPSKMGIHEKMNNNCICIDIYDGLSRQLKFKDIQKAYKKFSNRVENPPDVYP
jgi:hypothetical protein